MKQNFPKSFQHKHDTQTILNRLSSKANHSYLKDAVYGAIDGSVTTFAVIAGVVGAALPSRTIVILGIANLLADGFSMAASNYLGTKTENQQLDLLRKFENYQIEQNPEGETNEVRNILKEMQFSGDLLEKNIQFYTSNKRRWVDFMIQNEYQLSGQKHSEWTAALTTFASFALCGSIPLLSYLFDIAEPFLWSSILTALSFIIVGSLKSRWTVETAFLSSVKTLAVGGLASTIAYLAGSFIGG